MDTPRRRRRAFLTDEEKRTVLDDLRNSLDSGNLTSDLALAKKVSRITANVEHLAKSAQTTADISFTINLVHYTVDCVTTHLESNDPSRELFHELTVADGISMTSWCPSGYEQLEQITKACIPLRLSFNKYITIKDLEDRRGDSKEAPEKREKKKREPSRLNKLAAVQPKNVVGSDETPTHKVNMEKVLDTLVSLTQDGPLPYFKFVINPNSFVQTVYNIFLVSFLVHGEHALLSVGEKDELFIEPSSESMDDASQDEETSNIQLIQSISPKEWIALVKHLNLTSPLIPELCPKDSQYFQDSQLSSELTGGATFLKP